MVFENITENDYGTIAKEIFNLAGNIKIWTFNGNLGAGKTTLIKHLCKTIGIKDTVQSPTFSIVNCYGDLIYHFDCYRLKSLDEAMDIGIEEYLDSGKYCWIEWPDVIMDLLPNDYIEINIEDTKRNSRNIEIKKIE